MNTQNPNPLLGVIPAEETYQAKPAKLAKGQALTELNRLGQMPLAAQSQECVLEITIAGTPTHWTRPIGRDAVPYKNSRSSKGRRLLIWDASTASIAVYESVPANNEWRRVLFTSDPAMILAELPKSMLSASDAKRAATDAQLSALRKLLDLPANASIPPLHISAASRLMDRILIENTVTTLRLDLNRLRDPVTPAMTV